MILPLDPLKRPPAVCPLTGLPCDCADEDGDRLCDDLGGNDDPTQW
jgi:hypothetical protein